MSRPSLCSSGAICWATGVGLAAYFLGTAAGNAISTFGLYGVLALVIAAGSVFVAHRRHQRRMQEAFKRSAKSPPHVEPPPHAEPRAPAETPPSMERPAASGDVKRP